MTIAKVSTGDVGTFGFSGTNGVPSVNITTTADGVAVEAPTIYLTAANTQTTITESTIPAGFELTDIACSGLGNGGSATPDLASSTITLDGAATAPGADILCTFTNERLSTDLAVTKTAAPNPVMSGGTVVYTINVNNNGPRGAANSVLTDTASAGQDCVTPANITCTASGGAQCPAAPIDPNILFGAGVVIPQLPAGSGVSFSVACTVTADGQP